jgi:Molybdopterin converting factor, small subunit
MSITVHLPTMLAKLAADQRTLEAQGATVGDALTDVIGRFPELGKRLRDDEGKPYPFVTFYLNDEDIRFLEGLTTSVSDTDTVVILPAMAGGSA